jgi:endo-1,4-beta-xylanase
MHSQVKSMKDAGVPIDAVGMQMHLLLPWNSQVPPSKDHVVATMRRFASLGVSVLITELDASIHSLAGSTSEKLATQARIYGDVAAACLESGVCRSFTTMGFSDADSWITAPTGAVKLLDAEPLPWDREYQPKPAYDSIWRTFAG